MTVDLIIKNGHVIDPATETYGKKDIAITGNRVVDIEGRKDVAFTRIVDASGCYVLPGLIDFHTHLSPDTSPLGTSPSIMAASGVTSAVDAGTCGCLNYPVFHKNTVTNSAIRIKTFLSAYSIGLCGHGFSEDYNPDLFNEKLIAQVVDKYSDEILGLKIRFSIPLAKDTRPLKKLVELGDRLGISLCVHTTNPPCDVEELVNCLRKGDIYTHMYHGNGNNILDERGNVKKAILAGRERGVIFDMAHGNNHFSNKVCKVAFKQGFYPDIIATDMTSDKMFYGIRARSLPFIMSKLMSMGMDFKDIVRCVTETPAKMMKMEGQIGTLRHGSLADVTIIRKIDNKFSTIDFSGDVYECDEMLVPQMTIIDGNIVFSVPDFSLAQ